MWHWSRKKKWVLLLLLLLLHNNNSNSNTMEHVGCVKCADMVHTYVCATDNLHTRIPIERVLQFDWVARLYAKSRKKADRLTSIREKCLVIHTSVLFINVYFLLSLLPGEGTRCECVSQFHCGCIAPTLSTATYTHTHVYKQGKRRYKK